MDRIFLRTAGPCFRAWSPTVLFANPAPSGWVRGIRQGGSVLPAVVTICILVGYTVYVTVWVTEIVSVVMTVAFLSQFQTAMEVGWQ